MMAKKFQAYRNVVELNPSPGEMRNIIDNWNISNQTESIPIDSDVVKRLGSLYAARHKNAKKPIYRAFRQPYIGLDTFFLQDIYANTPAGRVVDFISYLISGSGFRPVLKRRNASQYEDQTKIEEETKTIDEKYRITDTLINIDHGIGNPDGNPDTYEHTLPQKVDGLLKLALVYGRGMNVRIANGSTYDLYPIHPRDIVYNVVNQEWKLQAILTTLSDEPYTMNQVIYAEWNPENPIYNIMYNGYSFMQRMLDPARALRRIKGTDMQLIAKKRWAGSAIIAMAERTKGSKDARKLLQFMEGGRIYVTEETDPEKAYHIHEIPLEKGSEKIVDMATWLTHDIIALGGVPTTLFYDESSANHNVFDIRIRAFQKQIEEEFRPWASAILTKQWYMRNFYDIFGDQDVYKKYRVECEFEPVDFSSLTERTKALKLINDIFPITPGFAGEHLGIENFESKIDLHRKVEKRQEFQISRESDTESRMSPI